MSGLAEEVRILTHYHINPLSYYRIIILTHYRIIILTHYHISKLLIYQYVWNEYNYLRWRKQILTQ